MWRILKLVSGQMSETTPLYPKGPYRTSLTAWIMSNLSMASASSLKPATSLVFFSVIVQNGWVRRSSRRRTVPLYRRLRSSPIWFQFKLFSSSLLSLFMLFMLLLLLLWLLLFWLFRLTAGAWKFKIAKDVSLKKFGHWDDAWLAVVV